MGRLTNRWRHTVRYVVRKVRGKLCYRDLLDMEREVSGLQRDGVLLIKEDSFRCGSPGIVRSAKKRLVTRSALLRNKFSQRKKETI